MADKTSDETDLVNVGEISAEEDVTEARTRSEVSSEASDDPFSMPMETSKPGQTTIASLRERFAAFVVDAAVLWLVYWGCLYVFNKLMFRSWVGSVPTMGYRAMLFHGAFLLIAFLYFFLLEAAFFATIGKFSCWMYVRRKDGRHAGALAVLVRNFFRLIELLTALLLTWIPMELTRRHQRLGDLAAGTIVIKKHSAGARYYPLDADKLASAFGRWLTWMIDIPLFVVWVIGYVMFINHQSVIVSQWLVVLFPVVALIFWATVQLILETTPGKWLFGYTITQEDGGQLTFASALLRTLFAPVDLLMGFIAILLSLRKQAIGDVIAATVVSRQRRRWKGAVGSLLVVALSVGLVALGLFINPKNNVFKAGADFQLGFMPTVEGMPTWGSSMAGQPTVLTASNFRFGVEDANTYRTPPVYEAGEKVYLRFEISGYTREDRMIWVQEDLMVQYPDGAIGLRQENVVDYHQIVQPGGKPIELTNNIALPATAPAGTYVVTITLRDLLANRFSITETQSFTVKAPPAAMPVPEISGPTDAPVLPPSAPIEATEPAPSIPQQPTTVPSSPIPVSPTEPVAAPPAEAVAPTVPPASPTPPASGFTVIPGPSIAPKDVTPPPIPVPSMPSAPLPAAPAPLDSYGAGAPTTAPAAPSTQETNPAITPAPVPVPTTPTPAPVPVPVPIPAPAPAPVEPAPAAQPSVAPQAAAPTPTPSSKSVAPVTPPAQTAAPGVTTPPVPETPAKPAITEKTLKPSTAPAPAGTQKATIVKPSPKAPPPTDVQKAADEELKREATKIQAKPAADIPSADSVKQQSKKKSSGGIPSGGYMP